MLRRLSLTFIIALLAVPASGQVPRRPRVHVVHLRGPIQVQELRRAWTARSFRRCADELHADVAHVHVEIRRAGAVHVRPERPGEPLPPEHECVANVIRAARFAPQTEPTEAYVTVFFRASSLPEEPRRRR